MVKLFISISYSPNIPPSYCDHWKFHPNDRFINSYGGCYVTNDKYHYRSPIIRWEVCWRASGCWDCAPSLRPLSRPAWRWWKDCSGTCPPSPLDIRPAHRLNRCPGPVTWPRQEVCRCDGGAADGVGSVGDGDRRWPSSGCRPKLGRVTRRGLADRHGPCPAGRSVGPGPVSGTSSCTGADISSSTPVAQHIRGRAHTQTTVCNNNWHVDEIAARI